MLKRASTVLLLALVLLVSSGAAHAEISVVDNLGRSVTVKQPAKRIISLAPHVTENLFSAGAGAQVVGVVSYSNFPEAARSITSVGSYVRLNFEAIVALQPDLVVAWGSGNGEGRIQTLLDLGLNVYVSEPKSLETIAVNIENYGILSGHESQAREVSRQYRQTLSNLQSQYSQRPPVSVFYQVWNNPLQSVNGKGLISAVIRLCGGYNVYADAIASAPKVSLESVLSINPQTIVASGMGEARPEWLDEWRQWPGLQAVAAEHLYFIPPDYLQRHTARVLIGAEMLCQKLDRVR